jgi:hypothetical protein
VAAYLALAISLFLPAPDAKTAATAFNLLTLLSLLIASAVSLWAYRFATEKSETRQNRFRLTTGLILWSLAQLLWFFFPGILTTRGTFLTIADILWFIGSFLLLRVLAFQDDQQARTKNSSVITGVSTGVAVVTAIPLFISLPTLFSLDWDHLLGFLARIAYFGLTLAIVAFASLSFSYKNRGSSTVSHNTVSAAFIFWAIASFIQFYFAWFAPSTQKFAAIPAGLIPGVYLIIAANIYLTWVFEQQTGLGAKLKLGFIGKDREIPQFLLHTDASGKIVFISSNFLQFTNNSLPERYLGKDLREVLGFSQQEFDRLTETCARGAFIVQQDIKVAAGQKAPVPLFMTAVGSITGSEYFGMDLILHLPNYSGQAYPLDPESSAIAQRILVRTGQHGKENSALLAEYFIAQVQAYKELITANQGSKAAAGMDREVNALAEKNKWPIRLSGLELDIEPGFDNFDNAEMIKAMPVLFKVAQQYTGNLTGAEAVARQTAIVNKTLSEKIMQAAKQFGLR